MKRFRMAFFPFYLLFGQAVGPIVFCHFLIKPNDINFLPQGHNLEVFYAWSEHTRSPIVGHQS
jgi:hypothetical protein